MNTATEDPRLTAYALGELVGDERAALEAELASSEHLRDELSGIEATLDAIRSELGARPERALDDLRRERIRQELGGTKVTRIEAKPRRRGLRAAVFTALACW